MSKKCARCERAVYPAEELKCFDKSWHKTCFKCWECGMALTLKNCKGFNKLPYCNAHYPQLSATVVADTPELRRLSQTSQMQSTAEYHREFEKNIRGTVTSIAEDNDMRRAKEIGNIISPSSYRQKPANTGGEDYNGSSETSYTRPMRSYNEEEGYNEAPRSCFPSQPNAGRVLPPTPQTNHSQGPVYTALYDYDAQDDDEVSFQEHDKVLDCEVVDEGWVKGTVQRTGQRGMIPANYIEQN